MSPQAARNCLVNAALVVKVSDFGMARYTHTHTHTHTAKIVTHTHTAKIITQTHTAKIITQTHTAKIVTTHTRVPGMF